MGRETKRARGRFFVLDGVDGCGKSTQARRLCEALERASSGSAGAPLHLREPGSTRAGERLRALLLDPETQLEPQVETLLFAAARRQMLVELVEPALAAGRDVVCERFHASTFAYQAVAGELSEDAVVGLLAAWANAPTPDLVLLLDVSVDIAFARAAVRSASAGDEADRIEARGIEFQRSVARGFRRFAELSPLGARVVLVDADGSADEVARRVIEEVQGADR